LAEHDGLTAEELDFPPSLKLWRTSIPSAGSGQTLNDDTRLRRTTSFRLRAGRFDGQVGGQVKYRLGRAAGEEEGE
jgi:hypothetical protein